MLPAAPKVPAEQSKHVEGELTSLLVAREMAYFPELQVTCPLHKDVASPCVDPYVPAGQSVHEEDPGSEYVPL
jgi:hypothetical protein